MCAPPIEECYALIDWVNENNVLDLVAIRFKIHDVHDDGLFLVILCEWRYRLRSELPYDYELRMKPGWNIEKWTWDGKSWITCFWRNEV